MVVSRARSSYRVRNRLDATFPKKGWEAGSFLTGLPRDVPRATHALCLSILLPKSVSLGTSFRTRTHTHTHTHTHTPKQTNTHTHTRFTRQVVLSLGSSVVLQRRSSLDHRHRENKTFDRYRSKKNRCADIDRE